MLPLPQRTLANALTIVAFLFIVGKLMEHFAGERFALAAVLPLLSFAAGLHGTRAPKRLLNEHTSRASLGLLILALAAQDSTP